MIDLKLPQRTDVGRWKFCKTRRKTASGGKAVVPYGDSSELVGNDGLRNLSSCPSLRNFARQGKASEEDEDVYKYVDSTESML